MTKPITDFFRDLGYPLKNIQWSWGARAGDSVLLRAWDDEPGIRKRTVSVLRASTHPRKSGRNGRKERIKQLEFLWSGEGTGYVVMLTAKDRSAPKRSIKSYRDDVVFPIRRLEEQDDGAVTAQLGPPIRVERLATHAGTHRTSQGIGPFPGSQVAKELRKRAARFAKIQVRTGQTAFRAAVFYAYGGRCAVSGCAVPAALEAAHRRGRDWKKGHNAATDGILLRSDLHGLYDRRLLSFDSRGRVKLRTEAVEHYGAFQGKVTLVPR